MWFAIFEIVSGRLIIDSVNQMETSGVIGPGRAAEILA